VIFFDRSLQYFCVAKTHRCSLIGHCKLKREDTLMQPLEKRAINKRMQKKSRTLRTHAQRHFSQVRTKYDTLFIAFSERSCRAWSLSCDNFFLIVKTERAKNRRTLTRWPLVKSSKTACKICRVAKSVRLLLQNVMFAQGGGIKNNARTNFGTTKVNFDQTEVK
jgi:hypothetical protein